MRRIGFFAGALFVAGALFFSGALLFSSGAQAQAWVSYFSAEDRFAIGFPSEPRVEDTEWIGENGEVRAARRYVAERAGNTYALIAVDYSDADDETLRRSYAHAASVYRHKGEVTFDEAAQIDRIDGHQLQITQEDGRRIYFAAHVHGGRLYILDANVSARSAPPGQFQQNLQIVDEEGVRVRYTLEGERMLRTDDLQDALGGPDLDGPILEGNRDQPIAR